jgi:hypothetical protein
MAKNCGDYHAIKPALQSNLWRTLLWPNCAFNVDANSGHAFGIFMAAVGALRPCGAPAPVN